MKTKFRRLISLGLMSLLLIIALPFQSSSAGSSDLICVGLYYGTDTLSSANLESNTGYGSGYRFGCYTDDYVFIELGRTDSTVTQITVLRASDYYRSGSTYSMTDNGGEAIGCYHISVATGITTFEEARELADLVDGGFVAWISGQYEVRTGAYLTKDEALTAQIELGLESGTICGTTSYAMNTVETGSSQIIFQFDGGVDSALGIYPDVTGVEEPRVWFKGYRYTGAFRYARLDGTDISVTTVIDLETYVKGVIPYEMNNSWPLEALKAQAICARTYAQIGIDSSKHSTFDLCNTTCCQVYNGIGTNSSSYQATDLTDQAVDETAGQYLWYDGELAQTYYSSSHGGGSESIENVWGTSLSLYPYLCGVIDPYESLVSDINAYSDWTRTYTSDELLAILQSKGAGVGTTLDGVEAVYSKTGNVTELIFYFANGKTVTWGPSVVRSSSYLSVPSIRFYVNGNMVDGTESTTVSGGVVTANDGESLASTLYTINGSLSMKVIDTDDTFYVITETGDIEEIRLDGTEITETTTGTDLSGSTYTEASTYVFSGSGWGHSLGFSQYGAYAMADVMGMDYDEIVTFYFPGTYVS